MDLSLLGRVRTSRRFQTCGRFTEPEVRKGNFPIPHRTSLIDWLMKGDFYQVTLSSKMLGFIGP